MSTDIAKLRYDTVIKNEVPQMDVFVEADEDASRIWRQAVEIMSIENALERKNRFKEMKKDFYKSPARMPPIFNRGMNGGLVFLSDCAII